MTSIQQRVLLAIVRYASYGVFIIPLFVTRTTFFPYIFGKILLFQALVETAGAAWFILILFYRQYRPSWKNPVVLSVTTFIALLTVSSFTGASPVNSLWSTQERMTGLITLLHLWVWFLILHSCFRTAVQWDRLIRFSVVVSLFVGLYGIAQNTHLPFVVPNHALLPAAE